jgi:hypothetical protein
MEMDDSPRRKKRQIWRSQVTGRCKSFRRLADRQDTSAEKKVKLAPPAKPRPPTVHEIPAAFPVSRAFVAELSLGPAKFTFVHFGRNEMPTSA